MDLPKQNKAAIEAPVPQLQSYSQYGHADGGIGIVIALQRPGGYCDRLSGIGKALIVISRASWAFMSIPYRFVSG